MSPQQSIAHYRITSKLGEGGMGEVYRATDTKLNREVAIKILPESVAHDPDRLARFTREAQLLASLNHPNIAAIYGVEERAIVMELVEGATLAERIQHGPIPPDEALPIARQIAEALEYAHEHGVIHRDLKPANVKITPDRRVKVLDFGLAKAMSIDTGSADPVASPTLTMRATITGAIMGTAAYMSPEQARGQAVDRRADIWAFGVLLHEMLTGRQLFAGPTISDTLASVLKSDIDTTEVPAHLRFIVDRCLRKDVRRRWQSIGDVRIALEEDLSAQPAAGSPAVPPRSSRFPWTVAGILALSLVAAATLWWRASRPVSLPYARLMVDLGPGSVVGSRTTAILSPDGSRIVFPLRTPDGKQQLAMRVLNRPEITLLYGTDNGSDPFFSPDGQWMGFFAEGRMKKLSIQGGAISTLCDAYNGRGASWGADGNIVVTLSSTSGGGLSRVPDSGGAPQMLTKPTDDGKATHRWPQILPGGEMVLFTGSKSIANYDNSDLEVLSLKTGKIHTVQKGGYFGRYVPGGYLVYLHQGNLFAVRFDLTSYETRGAPQPILDDVNENSISAGGQFDLSAAPAGHGTFVYLSGKTGFARTASWLDAAGKFTTLLSTPGAYTDLRLSPDGKRLALSPGGVDIQVYDMARDAMTNITFNGPENRFPVWTPDGKHIVYHAAAGNGAALRWMRSDGAGEAQSLIDGAADFRPFSFTPDGKHLAFSQSTAGAPFEIRDLPLDTADPEHPKPGKPVLLFPAGTEDPQYSPDGHWIAYASLDSGRNEVFVRPFTAAGTLGTGKWSISNAGGRMPTWSPKTHELFYEGLDNRIMVVAYTVSGDTFVPDKPRAWSDVQLLDVFPSRNLDVAPDGRFAVLPRPESVYQNRTSTQVTFLLNFTDELRRRMP